MPAQQYYPVSVSPQLADFVLSLNNSILQLGIAVGASIGGLIFNIRRRFISDGLVFLDFLLLFIPFRGNLKE